MNCRERVLRAIRFERPDRIPFTYTITPRALFQHGQRLIDLCRKHSNDFFDPSIVTMPPRDTAHYRPDGTYYKEVTDEWGSVWTCFQEGIMGEVKRPVLGDWARLRPYRFPPLPGSAPAERKRAREDMRRQKERYIGWGAGGSLFEQMQWLRGTENLLVDLALDAEEVCVLADLLLERRILPAIELALEAGADVVGFTDDWGSQRQLLIRPDLWRRIFKPRYRRMFDLVRQGGALPWMHSDGAQLDIIPDWIETGLAVLNAQFVCNDMAALRRLAGDKLCICGDLDRQGLLPNATPSEIRAYCRRTVEVFGSPQGGFIYGLAVEEIPFENVVAVLEAIEESCSLPAGG